MKLSGLLTAIPPDLHLTRYGNFSSDPTIRSIEIDSRSVAPGALFVAIRGASHDGHDFLEEARKRGAVAFLVENVPKELGDETIPIYSVTHTRKALAPIATHFFGFPAGDMSLIGITGTNGKTSTSYLVESILTTGGTLTGVVGTIEFRFGSERMRSLNTTPESLELQRILRTMHTAGVRAVAMEISSHGLALGRVDGCKFRVGAFTNLTQDHLDFHGNMESYLESKLILFRSYLFEGASAVVNIDDAAAPAFVAAANTYGAKLIRVTMNPAKEAEIRLTEHHSDLTGSHGRLQLPKTSISFDSPLLGEFNLENLLVATGIAVAMDVSPADIAKGIHNCPQVPGRIERLSTTDEDPTVIVDYAHTPDAIDKLLTSLRALTSGRLITVFGCGGDRDRQKRPLMARAAAHHSDLIIATSDNPRTENPEVILAQVEEGLVGRPRTAPERLGQSDGCYTTVLNRREAIELAVQIAHTNDTVVIAGKGHEDYQIIGSTRFPFSDRSEALRALRRRKEEAAGRELR